MENKKKPNVLFWVCLLILIAAVAFGIVYQVKQKQREASYEKMTEEAAADPLPEPDDGADPKQPDIPIDFKTLQDRNPDIYAWIQIPGTQVDYPIVQSQADDDYYLNRTVEGEEGLPGSIYTQAGYNHADMMDPVTVIYGHNMRDDSMFGGLSSYLDEEFADSHSEIRIYTPEHIFTYQVICAVTYDDRHILETYDCSLDKEYERFISSLKNEKRMPSRIGDAFDVTTQDRMIILSTCNGYDAQRFLVGAVLTDEE